MLARSQSGFTLIELILVMAITASLAGIAFVGQQQLRARAQFDSDVNKLVVSISQAGNEAAAGINFSGQGNGTGIGDACTGVGPTAPQTQFAGDVFTADNALPTSPFEITFYKVSPGVKACTFNQTQVIDVPSGITVTSTGGRDVFVRNQQGGVDACPVTNLGTDIRPYFVNGSCAVNTWAFTVKDSFGNTSKISIDESGLASRVN